MTIAVQKPGPDNAFRDYAGRLLHAYARHLPQDDDYLRTRHGALFAFDGALKDVGREEYDRVHWREQLALRLKLSETARKFGYPEVHNSAFEDRFNSKSSLNKRIFLRPTQDPDDVLIKGDYYFHFWQPENWHPHGGGIYNGRDSHEICGLTVFSPIFSNSAISSLMGLMVEHDPNTTEFGPKETTYDRRNLERFRVGDLLSIKYWPKNYRDMEIGTYPVKFDGRLSAVDLDKRKITIDRESDNAIELKLSELPLTILSLTL